MHHGKFNLRSILSAKRTSWLQWKLDDIRIEKIISAPIWATKWFLEVSALLDVGYCPKLQSCAISRKTNHPTLRK